MIKSIGGYLPPEQFAAAMEDVLKKYEAPKQKAATNEEKPALAEKTPAAKKPDEKVDMEALRVKAKKQLEKMKNCNLELSGILYNPKSPKAIINNHIARVGDEIEGARVISISRDSVEMLVIKQNKKLILKID